MARAARPLDSQHPGALGVTLREDGSEISVFSHNADTISVCTFDESGAREVERWILAERNGDVFSGFIPDLRPGGRYGLRADGPYDPDRGLWFDPAKLLVDPYTTRIDRPFRHHDDLSAPRDAVRDTADLVPRAIVEAPFDMMATLRRSKEAPGFIYEVCVRAFTQLHPDIPLAMRGTLEGLSHPALLDHMVRLGVTHVELMPIAAWMDERHLPPLGLANAWGYNPIAFMALQPQMAPNGFADLRDAVARLHQAGISVLLDVVFNHTAESDRYGATISLRGLDNLTYYRHATHNDGLLINDSGCGNTLACDRAPVVRLVMDCMRTFVQRAGIDGFRFDLGPILGRTDRGFDPEAPLMAAIAQDPVLRDIELIAEPWDIGPGGYALGAFPAPFREWNDQYRDDVRKFWKGEAGTKPALATRLAGSSDIFAPSHRTPGASVNFVAAHDGFCLGDVVRYADKHNEANGEANRDGANENHSWNCGVEGDTGNGAILEERARDIRAMIATLFLSRGVPMLTAGDEFGRTQRGNNNAYAQENATTWLEWEGRDRTLEDFTAEAAALRRRLALLRDDRFLTGAPWPETDAADVVWLRADGSPMHEADWHDDGPLALILTKPMNGMIQRVHLAFNNSAAETALNLPQPQDGHRWMRALDSVAEAVDLGPLDGGGTRIPARGVLVHVEERADSVQ